MNLWLDFYTSIHAELDVDLAVKGLSNVTDLGLGAKCTMLYSHYATLSEF